MGLRRLAAAVFIALAAGAAGADTAGQPPLAGEMRKFSLLPAPRPAPEIEFTELSGAPARLADFRGRVVLLNLWATWCAPCVEEMPSLGRLQAALGTDDFRVLALSSDRGGARVVEPFLEKLGAPGLDVFLDPKSIATRKLGARGLPTSILVDRAGNEIGRLEGSARWDSPEAAALIRSYLGGRKESEGIVRTSAGRPG